MATYLIRRLLLGIVSLLVGSCLVFFAVMDSAGDPRERLVLCDGCDQSAYDVQAERYKLDEPFPVQYGFWMYRAASGDIDPASSQGERSIPGVVVGRLANTALLVVPAWLIATAISATLASRWVRRPRGLGSTVGTVATSWSLVVPTFVTGLLFQSAAVVVFDRWGVRPFQTQGMDRSSIAGLVSAGFLPTLTLTASIIARRYMPLRSALKQAWSDPSISAARARGIPEKTLLWRHALRLTTGTFATVTWFEAGLLIGGTAVVETVFSWPGIGLLIVDSIGNVDVELALVLGISSLSFSLLVGIVVDMAHAALDPRVRDS